MTHFAQFSPDVLFLYSGLDSWTTNVLGNLGCENPASKAILGFEAGKEFVFSSRSSIIPKDSTRMRLRD